MINIPLKFHCVFFILNFKGRGAGEAGAEIYGEMRRVFNFASSPQFWARAGILFLHQNSGDYIKAGFKYSIAESSSRGFTNCLSRQSGSSSLIC